MKNGYLAKHLSETQYPGKIINIHHTSKFLIPGQQHMTEDLGALLPL